MLALQITLNHWFYLYIPWFYPMLLVALAALPAAERATPGSRNHHLRESNPPAPAGLTSTTAPITQTSSSRSRTGSASA